MNRHEQDARASRRIGTDCKSALSGCKSALSGFFGPVGWAIGATYLGADIISKGITGKSLGNHLDEYVEERFDIDNGAIIDMSGK